MKILFRFVFLSVALLSLTSLEAKVKYTSGSVDIDAVRESVRSEPTGANNFYDRLKSLYMWIAALQQQGANTLPFFDVDTEYYRTEMVFNRQKASQPNGAVVKAMYQLIDRGFGVVEDIQTTLVEKGAIYEPFEGTDKGFPEGGDMNANWTMFQANEHNDGNTTAPGPVYGRLAWKNPVGLGWYARPVVDGDRVYISSPGTRTTSFCVDIKTGENIWRSTQEHPLFGVYKYPGIASTPLIVGDKIVLRETNSHGGNNGQARNLVYLNKQTGETEFKRYAGHVDYRTRYAPVATNGKFVVYPFGVSDIYQAPAVCQNFNRLICADAENNRKYWDFNVGDIDALAEPLMDDNRVYQGTMEGYLYALNLTQSNGEKLVSWMFKAEGSVNTMVAKAGNNILFGSNGGVVYSVNSETGDLVWQSRVEDVEKSSRKHFSTPTVEEGVVYVGASNNRLYAFDERSGEQLWSVEVSDWIRSRPAIVDGEVKVATVDGALYGFSLKGKELSRKVISTHPIYADLVVGAAGELLVTDSNLMMYCLNSKGKQMWDKSLLESFTADDGERIFTDVLSGGTFYQSKPTAANGIMYYGTPSGFIHAVDADSGEELWKFEMGGGVSVGPAIQDGMVYVGQQGGERFFYGLDAKSGEMVWRQTIPGGWVWGSATVSDGKVYIPTVSGYAMCLDGKSGNIIWMYPTAKSVPAEPAVDGDLVYFGSWSNSLYAFNKHTGEVVWKFNGVGLDSGTLIARDGKIYLPHHNDIFMYFDSKTGEVLNNGNTNAEDKGLYSNFNASPAFADGRAFFTARVGVGLRGIPLSTKVYSVDAQTAKVHWTFPDGGGLSAPALASGRVYIGSGNTPLLYCLSQKTGEPHWIYKLGNRVEESTLCIYRDKLYVLASDGYIHAIE